MLGGKEKSTWFSQCSTSFIVRRKGKNTWFSQCSTPFSARRKGKNPRWFGQSEKKKNLMVLPRRDAPPPPEMDVCDAYDEVFLPQDFPTDSMQTIGRCSVSTLPALLSLSPSDRHVRTPLLAGYADGTQVLPRGEGPPGRPHRHHGG